jgi:hypothetical protein
MSNSYFLSALAAKQNPQLESQIISKRVSELQLKQIKAAGIQL